MHLSRHPGRNWGIILHQVWVLRMKDRVGNKASWSSGNSSYSGSGSSNYTLTSQAKKICYKYNRGKCTYGFNCKFDHRCGVCGKVGHGAHICRKAKVERIDYDYETGERQKEYRERGFDREQKKDMQKGQK